MPRLSAILCMALIHSSAAFVPLNRQASSSALQMTDVYKGTVKWFDNTKGFGFVTRKEDGEDFFVHQSAVQAPGFRSLEDGTDVEFQVEEQDGKTKAVCVTGPGGKDLPRGYAYKKQEESSGEKTEEPKKSYYF